MAIEFNYDEIIHPTPDGVFLLDTNGRYNRLADTGSIWVNGFGSVQAEIREVPPDSSRQFILFNGPKFKGPKGQGRAWLVGFFKALEKLTTTSLDVIQQSAGVLKSCPKIITLSDEQRHHLKEGMEIEQKIYDKEIEREERVHAGEDQAVVRKKTQVELVEYKWYLYHRGAVKTIDQINKDFKSPKDIV